MKDSTDAAPIIAPSASFAEIRESLDKRLFKEKKPPSPPPLPLPPVQQPKEEKVAAEGVTISSGMTTTVPEDNCNLIVVSNNQGDRQKANTSTITIISDLPDLSNSLASNISQVGQVCGCTGVRQEAPKMRVCF